MTPTRRQAAERIVRTLQEEGHEAYFCGGCVRDRILGIEPADHDVATAARPEQIERLFRRTRGVGRSFGVVLVVSGPHTFEVATFRTEGRYSDGRRPDSVWFGTLEQDVARRDFTINGLMEDPVAGVVVDLVGGRADFERRLVRTIGDPDLRFAEDHLRLLRAVRFAARFDFEIEEATGMALRRHADRIRQVAAERVRMELEAMLTGPRPDRSLELLETTGLLAVVLPEIQALRGVRQPPEYHPEGDVLDHTRLALSYLPESPPVELALAVLLHDAGKPLCRMQSAERGMRNEEEEGTADAPLHLDVTGARPEESIEGSRGGGVPLESITFHGHEAHGERIAREVCERLRFPGRVIERVTALVADHMKFLSVRQMRRSTLKRFLRKGDFELQLELHRIDRLAASGDLSAYEFCRARLCEFDEAGEPLAPAPLLDGDDLVAMGLTPGPLFQEILRRLEDKHLEGELVDAPAAREWVLAEYGDRVGSGR